MSGYVLGLRGFQPLHPIINISLSQGKGIGSSFSLLTNSNYVFSNSISKQLVLSLWSSPTITPTSSSCTPKLKSQATKSQAGSSSSWPQQQSQKQEEEEEEEFQVVTAIRSQFNDILILDTPNSRILLLDATRKLSHNKSLVIKTTSLTPTLWVHFWPSCLFVFSLCWCMQIMFIAFFTRTRNGLVPIGYVKLLSFFIVSFICLNMIIETR